MIKPTPNKSKSRAGTVNSLSSRTTRQFRSSPAHRSPDDPTASHLRPSTSRLFHLSLTPGPGRRARRLQFIKQGQLLFFSIRTACRPTPDYQNPPRRRSYRLFITPHTRSTLAYNGPSYAGVSKSTSDSTSYLHSTKT